MSLTVAELKERILQEYDPDDIIEILQLSSEELLDAFPEKMLQYRGRFEIDDDKEASYAKDCYYD